MLYPTLEEGHEVLGPDYCPGYTGILGEWNTGFYCPKILPDVPVYCCGTILLKYCCTLGKPLPGFHSKGYDATQQHLSSSENGMDLHEEEEEDEEMGLSNLSEIPSVRTPVNDDPDLNQKSLIFIGVLCGLVTMIVLITAVSCFYCSCCVLYKKRRERQLSGGLLYGIPASSTSATCGLINSLSAAGGTVSSTNVTSTCPNFITTTPLNPLVDYWSSTGGASSSNSSSACGGGSTLLVAATAASLSPPSLVGLGGAAPHIASVYHHHHHYTPPQPLEPPPPYLAVQQEQQQQAVENCCDNNGNRPRHNSNNRTPMRTNSQSSTTSSSVGATNNNNGNANLIMQRQLSYLQQQSHLRNNHHPQHLPHSHHLRSSNHQSRNNNSSSSATAAVISTSQSQPSVTAAADPLSSTHNNPNANLVTTISLARGNCNNNVGRSPISSLPTTTTSSYNNNNNISPATRNNGAGCGGGSTTNALTRLLSSASSGLPPPYFTEQLRIRNRVKPPPFPATTTNNTLSTSGESRERSNSSRPSGNRTHETIQSLLYPLLTSAAIRNEQCRREGRRRQSSGGAGDTQSEPRHRVNHHQQTRQNQPLHSSRNNFDAAPRLHRSSSDNRQQNQIEITNSPLRNGRIHLNFPVDDTRSGVVMNNLINNLSAPNATSTRTHTIPSRSRLSSVGSGRERISSRGGGEGRITMIADNLEKILNTASVNFTREAASAPLTSVSSPRESPTCSNSVHHHPQRDCAQMDSFDQTTRRRSSSQSPTRSDIHSRSFFGRREEEQDMRGALDSVNDDFEDDEDDIMMEEEDEVIAVVTTTGNQDDLVVRYSQEEYDGENSDENSTEKMSESAPNSSSVASTKGPNQAETTMGENEKVIRCGVEKEESSCLEVEKES